MSHVANNLQFSIARGDLFNDGQVRPELNNTAIGDAALLILEKMTQMPDFQKAQNEAFGTGARVQYRIFNDQVYLSTDGTNWITFNPTNCPTNFLPEVARHCRGIVAIAALTDAQRNLTTCQQENADLRNRLISHETEAREKDAQIQDLSNKLLEQQDLNNRLQSQINDTNGQIAEQLKDLERGLAREEVLKVELDSLRNENGDLKTNLQNANQEVANLRAAISEAQKTISKKSEELAERGRETDRLRQEINILKEQKSGVENRLEKALRKVRILTNQLQAANAEISKLKTFALEIMGEKVEAENALAKLRQKSDEQAKKIESLTKKNAEIETALTEARRVQTNQASQLRDNADQIQTLITEKAALADQLQAANIAQLQLRERISNLETQLESKGREIRKNEGEIHRLKAQVQRLEAEHQELKNRVIDAEAQNKQLRHELDQKNDQVTQNAVTIANLQSSLRDKNHQIGELTNKLYAAQHEFEKAKKAKLNVEQALRAEKDRTSTLKDEVTKLTRDLRNKNEECQKKAHTITDLENQLNNLVQRIEDLTTQLEKAHNDGNALKKLLEESKKRLAETEAALTEQLQLRESISHLESQLQDKESEIRKKEDEINRLKTQFQNLKQEQEQLQKSVIDTQDQNQKLQHELDQKHDQITQNKITISGLESALRDKNDQIEEADGEISALKELLEKLNLRLAEITAAYEAQQIDNHRQAAELHELSQRKVAIENRLDEVTKNKDAKIKALEKDREEQAQELSETIEHYCKQLDAKDKVIGDQLARLAQDTAENSELEAVIEDQIIALQHLADENAELRAKLRDLQKNLAIANTGNGDLNQVINQLRTLLSIDEKAPLGSFPEAVADLQNELAKREEALISLRSKITQLLPDEIIPEDEPLEETLDRLVNLKETYEYLLGAYNRENEEDDLIMDQITQAIEALEDHKNQVTPENKQNHPTLVALNKVEVDPIKHSLHAIRIRLDTLMSKEQEYLAKQRELEKAVANQKNEIDKLTRTNAAKDQIISDREGHLQASHAKAIKELDTLRSPEQLASDSEIAYRGRGNILNGTPDLINELGRQARAFKKQVADLTAKLQEQSLNLATLQDELASTKRERDSAINEAARLGKEHVKLQDELAITQGQLQKFRNLIGPDKDIERTLTDLISNNDRYNNVKNDLRRLLPNTVTLESPRDLIEAVRKELQTLTTSNQQLTSQLSQLNQALDRAHDTLRNLEDQIDKKSKVIEALTTKNKEHEATIHRVEGDYNAIKAELAERNQLLYAIEKKAKTLEATNNELTKALAATEAKNQELAKTLENQETVIKAKDGKIKQLEEELAQVRAQNGEQKKRIKELEKALADMTSERDALRDKVVTLTNRVTFLEDRVQNEVNKQTDLLVRTSAAAMASSPARTGNQLDLDRMADLLEEALRKEQAARGTEIKNIVIPSDQMVSFLINQGLLTNNITITKANTGLHFEFTSNFISQYEGLTKLPITQFYNSTGKASQKPNGEVRLYHQLDTLTSSYLKDKTKNTNDIKLEAKHLEKFFDMLLKGIEKNSEIYIELKQSQSNLLRDKLLALSEKEKLQSDTNQQIISLNQQIDLLNEQITTSETNNKQMPSDKQIDTSALVETIAAIRDAIKRLENEKVRGLRALEIKLTEIEAGLREVEEKLSSSNQAADIFTNMTRYRQGGGNKDVHIQPFVGRLIASYLLLLDGKESTLSSTLERLRDLLGQVLNGVTVSEKQPKSETTSSSSSTRYSTTASTSSATPRSTIIHSSL